MSLWGPVEADRSSDILFMVFYGSLLQCTSVVCKQDQVQRGLISVICHGQHQWRLRWRECPELERAHHLILGVHCCLMWKGEILLLFFFFFSFFPPCFSLLSWRLSESLAWHHLAWPLIKGPLCFGTLLNMISWGVSKAVKPPEGRETAKSAWQ